ncbi:MAG TPA: cytochrome c maturation protein CcmE [Gammaproteobacteria bacterium]|nr:cytochrome c maturation protein CcmE [Gammaproteobacteria bacterium]
MKPHRRRRLYFIIAILVGVSMAVSLAIYALGQNVNLYYTPTQLYLLKTPPPQTLRIGGMVKAGSFVRDANSLKVRFVLTDYQHEVLVHYTGILPALFRENQGIVVQGKLNVPGVFIADQVLAKHDEKYMPPGIKKHDS